MIRKEKPKEWYEIFVDDILSKKEQECIHRTWNFIWVWYKILKTRNGQWISAVPLLTDVRSTLLRGHSKMTSPQKCDFLTPFPPLVTICHYFGLSPPPMSPGQTVTNYYQKMAEEKIIRLFVRTVILQLFSWEKACIISKDWIRLLWKVF